jgi:hypothetical protein
MSAQTLSCGKWHAIHDGMPPLPARLHVSGECITPTPGYTITLQEAVPQGINPLILILEKTVIPPTGVEPQVLTTVPVHFTLKTDVPYTDVTILPDDVTIKVENVELAQEAAPQEEGVLGD